MLQVNEDNHPWQYDQVTMVAMLKFSMMAPFFSLAILAFYNDEYVNLGQPDLSFGSEQHRGAHCLQCHQVQLRHALGLGLSCVKKIYIKAVKKKH